jgi:[NiFe] hydrogenase assembly HybE family chaperone
MTHDAPTLDDPAVALATLWHAVAPRMSGLPIFNPALELQTTAFRRHGPWTVGIVVTPWFMNVVAIPDQVLHLPPPGGAAVVPLPGGDVGATVADLDGFGRFAAASLFSPMDEFTDPAVTQAVAEAALEALFRAADEAAAPASRRDLLFGLGAGKPGP